MTRRLILMRHAKSSWTSGAPTDHHRPLNGRGRRDAPRVAERLRELGWVPERVISSDSTRTRETWKRMKPELDGDDIDAVFTRRLYHGGVESIEEELSDQDDAETILVLGHNPGWEDALAWLTGEAERMTTANAALLECDAGRWLDGFEASGRWTLVDLLRPKEL